MFSGWSIFTIPFISSHHKTCTACWTANFLIWPGDSWIALRFIRLTSAKTVSLYRAKMIDRFICERSLLLPQAGVEKEKKNLGKIYYYQNGIYVKRSEIISEFIMVLVRRVCEMQIKLFRRNVGNHFISKNVPCNTHSLMVRRMWLAFRVHTILNPINYHTARLSNIRCMPCHSQACENTLWRNSK